MFVKVNQFMFTRHNNEQKKISTVTHDSYPIIITLRKMFRVLRDNFT